MKNKLFFSIVTMLCVLAFVSCSNSKKPEDVAKAFMEKILKSEFDDAKKFSCCEMNKILQSESEQKRLSKAINEDGLSEAVVDSCVANMSKDDETHCGITVYVSVDGKQKDKWGLDMSKEDGEWKVSMID